MVVDKNFDLEKRKPIWIALSHFYLDTELDKTDYGRIGKVFSESSFSIEKIKWINRHEVFPVLYLNMISVAGIWTGFDVEWLMNEIIKTSKKKRALKKLNDSIFYL